MCNTSFHDELAQVCFKQFQTLPKTGKPKDNEWTILSCVVLENEKKLEVVALGTGTKCIGQDKMSKDGDILNDSHAEVICRRAFLRFIYQEMLQEKSEIFRFNSEEQKFVLSDNKKFHFFSSHIPCGDAAIFPKQDSQEFGELLNQHQCNESVLNPKAIKRSNSLDSEVKKKKLKLDSDIFRTGAKCLTSDCRQDLKLEKNEYHITGVVRTKPGRGSPTLSVSCSDKISRWCHLGVQGALLSILLKNPIYFSSFIVSGGTPYNEEAMTRALFTRLKNVDLEPPFHQCEITLGQTTLLFAHEKSEDKNPSASSIIWTKGINLIRQTEVAVDGRRQGVTQKKLKTNGALQICKKQFFKNFVEVIKRLDIKINVNDIDTLTYKEAKMSSQQYQRAWTTLQKNFKDWTKKDTTLLDFRITYD